jgi:ZU5 domain
MKRLFLIKISLLLCAGALLWVACKKNIDAGSSGSSGPGGTDSVAITPVGTPIGTPITKNIGANGGAVTSADGNLVLTIPAGALPATTNITIQPVTSQMPGSVGLAYDLLPNGTKFNVPVTISFHYRADQFPGNNPEFSFIAYQDSSGAWVADKIQRDFDTTAKTVSLQVSHFTPFGLGQWLNLVIYPDSAHEGEKCHLTPVTYSIDPGKNKTLLHHTALVTESQIDSWQVNDVVGGTAATGTIARANPFSVIAPATYQAPDNIPQEMTVFVKCVTKIHEIIFKNGKQYEDNPKLSVKEPIKLIPPKEFNFTVTYEYRDSIFSTLYGILTPSGVPVYVDGMQFDVNIKAHLYESKVTITNVKNVPPVVSPNHAVTPLETFDWLADSIGMVNATKIFVDGQSALPADSIVRFYVDHTNAQLPGFLLRNNFDHTIQTIPVTPFGGVLGFPETIDVDLKQIPDFFSFGGNGLWEFVQVTPK